ncbi:hypothetical protein LSAT2_032728 [Lamellibrachia satsuma]|nr:hypothetical protein LSAT2_032728 [Lamellibrachia satsuma]
MLTNGSMKNMNALCLFVVATIVGTSMAMVKPAVSLKDLDPIDGCLFACNMCFYEETKLEKNVLLECANQVCLKDLPSGNPIDKVWLKACPGLMMFARRK